MLRGTSVDPNHRTGIQTNGRNAVTSADLKQAMQVVHLIPLLRRRFFYSKASVFLATGCPVVVSS